jgi:hypothetical protein
MHGALFHPGNKCSFLDEDNDTFQQKQDNQPYNSPHWAISWRRCKERAIRRASPELHRLQHDTPSLLRKQVALKPLRVSTTTSRKCKPKLRRNCIHTCVHITDVWMHPLPSQAPNCFSPFQFPKRPVM